MLAHSLALRPPLAASATPTAQAALTVVNGHGQLVEGDGAVGGDAQQGEGLLAVCHDIKVKSRQTRMML